jgi:hypothetical protein
MDNGKPLSFWEILTSTFAAAIGVQSKVNKERDYSRGNVVHFILAGIIFIILFVFSMIAVVQAVLAT